MRNFAIAVVTVYGVEVMCIWIGREGRVPHNFYTGKQRKAEHKTHELKKKQETDWARNHDKYVA
jgi:hypothetical protein